MSKAGEIQFYKGLWVTSARGIYVLFFGGMAGYFISFFDDDITLMGVIILPLPLVIAGAMNYFGVSDNMLFVRHHIFLLRRRRYLFSDIKHILFHNSGGPFARSANRLTITFNDGKEKSFQGATLRDKDWLCLMERLLQEGVRVEDKLGLTADPSKKPHPEFKNIMRRVYAYIAGYLVLLFGSFFFFPWQAAEWVLLTVKFVWIAFLFGGIFTVKWLILRTFKKYQ